MRITSLLLSLLILPLFVAAQEGYGSFVPLVGIPYVPDNVASSLGGYVNALYIAAISIAAVLAVLRIIYAGVQYMLSDIVTQKGEAKKTIRNALLGLILIVAAFLILNTINPQLTSLNSLDQLQGLNVGLTQDTGMDVDVGDEGDRTETDFDAFNEACISSGGQTKIVGDNLVCDQTTDVTAEEFADLLSERRPDLTEEEISDIISDFSQYIRPNASVDDAALFALASDTSNTMYDYLNNIVTADDVQNRVDELISGGAIDDGTLQQQVVAEIIRENSLYLQSSANQTQDDLDRTRTLCVQEALGTYVTFETEQEPYVICMN